MTRESSGMKWGGPVVQGSKDWLVLKKFTDNLLVALRVGKNCSETKLVRVEVKLLTGFNIDL